MSLIIILKAHLNRFYFLKVSCQIAFSLKGVFVYLLDPLLRLDIGKLF